MDKLLKWLAVLATVVMFLVMIAGSLVTKTDSAKGCGSDWPLCNGKWVPEYTLASIIEWSHRFVTGVAGLIVIVFSIWAWRRFRGNREVRALALFGLFFITLESILGASAVIWPQSSGVLALHFGFSLLAFTGVLLLSLFVLQRDKTQALVTAPVSKGFRNYVWLVTAYAYGVIYLGAYVRHTKSSLACPDWPLCRGELIPDLSGQVGIQFAHRLAAGIFLLLVLGLTTYTVRHFKLVRRDLYVSGILALLLAATQVLSGGLVIYYRLHLYATIFHSAVITCLFGILCYMCLQSLKAPQAEGAHETNVRG